MQRCILQMSQPARAVWIEILSTIFHSREAASQPARAVWIEIAKCNAAGIGKGSQPARAVWIEIFLLAAAGAMVLVTACEGCVD